MPLIVNVCGGPVAQRWSGNNRCLCIRAGGGSVPQDFLRIVVARSVRISNLETGQKSVP